MLCQQVDKHAIIFLKDVKFGDLKALVDYMYRGEVNVNQDQLASFLSTAEALRIKGMDILLSQFYLGLSIHFYKSTRSCLQRGCKQSSTSVKKSSKTFKEYCFRVIVF